MARDARCNAISAVPPVPVDWSALHSTAFLLLAMAACDGLLDDRVLHRVEERLARWPSARSDRLPDLLEVAHYHVFDVQARLGAAGFGVAAPEHVDRVWSAWGPAIRVRLLADLVAVAEADGSMTGCEVELLVAVRNLLRGASPR